MDAMEAILSRRSIRKYTSQPVSDDVVKELLEAGMSAPTAMNQRPWHFVVINDRRLLDEIPKFHPYSQMLKEAPLAILVCGDERLEKGKGYLAVDCSAATENILIAVQAKGLGAVWLGIYPREERMAAMRELLGLADNIVPVALISIGYSAERKPSTNRFDPSRVHYNGW